MSCQFLKIGYELMMKKEMFDETCAGNVEDMLTTFIQVLSDNSLFSISESIEAHGMVNELA